MSAASFGGAGGGEVTLTAYNAAVADYGPIDIQVEWLAQQMGNATQVASPTLYTFTRTAVYDIHLHCRSTVSPSAIGTGFISCKIDGVESFITPHYQAAGSFSQSGSRQAIAVSSGSVLTIEHGWYTSGTRPTVDYEVTIRENTPWAP